MANRPAPALVLRDGDRETLEGWLRSRTVSAGLAKRARMILLAADGVGNRQIAQRVGASPARVIEWRALSVQPCISSHIFLYDLAMGVRNYLIEGVSGTGKTSLCRELQRRGHHAINGDRELGYQGNPETGEPTDGLRHEHHIWHIDKVKSLVANQDDAVTFFCGGSRNFSKFIGLFDGVFVLEVDLETLNRRLDERPDDEWGGKRSERDLIVRLHQTKEDIPKDGIVIDATKPLARVVDEIIRQAGK